MKMQNLSIAINVKNGAQYLACCLNALQRFTDVVVLDNFSTDDTVAIAKSYTNVQLWQHEFCGMGKVRNLAAGYAKNDWVLFVDSDEVVTSELVDTLLSMQFIDGCIYRVLRHNFYANLRINTSSWGNDWILRLYNRQQNSFADNEVHDSFVVTGMTECKIMPGAVYHFPYDRVAKLIDKMQLYSTWYAKQHFKKKRPRLYTIPFRSCMAFIKCYLLQGGWRQGYEGLSISAYNAMGVFSKYIKLYEMYYKRNLAVAVTVANRAELATVISDINQQLLLPQLLIVVWIPNQVGNDSLIVGNDSATIGNDSLIAGNDGATIGNDKMNQYDFEQVLKDNLVVPGVVINANSTSLPPYLAAHPELDNILYVHDSATLKHHTLLKCAKTAVLAHKSFPGIDII